MAIYFAVWTIILGRVLNIYLFVYYSTGYIDDPELGMIYIRLNEITRDILNIINFVSIISVFIVIHCLIYAVILIILIINEKRKSKLNTDLKIQKEVKKIVEQQQNIQQPQEKTIVRRALEYCPSCGAELLDKAGCFCSKCKSITFYSHYLHSY